MSPAITAAGWLFGTAPSDRALAGWQPPVWLALGTNAIYRTEWEPLAACAPCGWTIRWHEAVSA